MYTCLHIVFYNYKPQNQIWYESYRFYFAHCMTVEFIDDNDTHLLHFWRKKWIVSGVHQTVGPNAKTLKRRKRRKEKSPSTGRERRKSGDIIVLLPLIQTMSQRTHCWSIKGRWIILPDVVISCYWIIHRLKHKPYSR